MPNNWKTYKLTELVENIVDNRGKTCPTAETGLPLIATNCIRNEKLYPDFVNVRYVSDETYNNWFRDHPKPNDLIFVLKGTPGRVCWTPNPISFCIAQDMVALRAKKEIIYPKYLFALLRSKVAQDKINALHVGSLIPHFKKTDFDKLELPVFEDLNYQKEVGDIYFDICDKIENNLAINKTLEEMAMALYKHWFVDFGPFQDGEFVESELGMIPKGWDVKRLDEIAYKRVESYKFKEKEKVVFVNTGDVLEGSFMHNNYMDVDELPGQAKKAIYPQDILFSEIRPANKRFAYVDFDSQDYVVSTKFMVIRNNELINNKLLYRIITREETIAEFQNIAESRSGTFPQITFDAIGHIQFALPSIDLQNEFQSIVGNWEEQQSNNLKENKSLIQLRDTLLPKLISGEIRLKEFREN
jgi:type I restriction enzyme S subunit